MCQQPATSLVFLAAILAGLHLINSLPNWFKRSHPAGTQLFCTVDEIKQDENGLDYPVSPLNLSLADDFLIEVLVSLHVYIEGGPVELIFLNRRRSLNVGCALVGLFVITHGQYTA